MWDILPYGYVTSWYNNAEIMVCQEAFTGRGQAWVSDKEQDPHAPEPGGAQGLEGLIRSATVLETRAPPR